MKSEFLRAITELAAEKNLPKEAILQAMEAALVSAHKKGGQVSGEVAVHIDRETGEHHVYLEKTAVEEVEDAEIEMSLPEALKFRSDAQLGDVISIEVFPSNAGRIAAQTAKQVVLQRLREAEREMVFEEFAGREADVVSGLVQRMDAQQVIVDLGKTEAVLPLPEQIRSEHYRPGARMKFYLLEVHRSTRGPQLVVSRTHKELLRRLFELEVPEIFKGVVEIKAIAREAGYRSKVAVTTRQEGVDPVGSCVGLRGIRIQNVVTELNGERIDVIQWDANPARFVARALSPAQVLTVGVNEEENTASVVVPDRQLSLAIGKEGQNARLAAKLTGWRIDIKAESTVGPGEITATEIESKVEEVKANEPARKQEPQPWMEVITEEEQSKEAPDSESSETVKATTEVKLPTDKSTTKPAIRFAEDVLASSPTPDTKKKKRRKNKDSQSEDGKTKKKTAKRARRSVIDDEDLDQLDVDADLDQLDVDAESDVDAEAATKTKSEELEI